MKFIKLFLCKIEFHSWGEIHKEIVQITGPHVLFFSWGHQDGQKTCLRCGKIQKLYRSGFVGNGCENPRWKKSSN